MGTQLAQSKLPSGQTGSLAVLPAVAAVGLAEIPQPAQLPWGTFLLHFLILCLPGYMELVPLGWLSSFTTAFDLAQMVYHGFTSDHSKARHMPCLQAAYSLVAGYGVTDNTGDTEDTDRKSGGGQEGQLSATIRKLSQGQRLLLCTSDLCAPCLEY